MQQRSTRTRTCATGAPEPRRGLYRATATALALAVATTWLLPTGAALAQPDDLARSITKIIRDTELGGADLGISVIECDTRDLLFEYNPSESIIPASNLKLVTSAVALRTLGPDHEFRTSFIIDGSTLFIHGSGDPGFADPDLLRELDLSIDGFLDRITEAVARTTDEPIIEIVVDDAVFDREYVHPTWEPDDLPKRFGAPVTGANFHGNVVRIYATPEDDPPARPRLRAEPNCPDCVFVNRMRTIKGKRAPSMWFQRDPDKNTFHVNGSVRRGAELSAFVTVHDPGLLFARLLAERLPAADQHTSEPPAVRYVGADERFDPDTSLVAVAVRTPMHAVARRCNADSENLYAECLLKACGNEATRQPGSWTNGVAVIRTAVKEMLGPDAVAGIVIRDGSGLSRESTLSARFLADWLVAIDRRDDRVASVFIDSLPTPGEGTLRRRFARAKPDFEVRAKSGFLTGVRSLSGYVTDLNTDRRIAFSILTDDIPAHIPGSRTREFHERIVLAIDDYMQATAQVAAEPALGG